MANTKKERIRAWQNRILTHSLDVLKPVELMRQGDKVPNSIYDQREDMENLVRLVGRQRSGKW